MTRITSTTGNGPQRNSSKGKFWRNALRQFRRSGQTVRAFCKQRGLAEPSFYAWRHTIDMRDGKPTPLASQPTFVELTSAGCVVGPRPGQPAATSGDAPLEILAGEHWRWRPEG
jgi:hypothetical protein